MNIELSQIIWTVICFALFALVLDRLLIRPVLGNIDRRREKIDGALGRKAELEESQKSAREANLAESEARRAAAEKENEKKLAVASAAADRELEALSAELKEREESALAEIAESASKNDEKLEAAMGKMIDAFTEILTTGGDL